MNTLLAWIARTITRLITRLRSGLSSINYRSKAFIVAMIGFLLLIALLTIGYQLLYPSKPIATADIYPFESVSEYKSFMEANPLFNKTVPEGKLFTKTESVRSDKVAEYTIELSERPLKPSMDTVYRESYISYLEHSQQQALEWIKSEGINPAEVHIIWRPDPVVMRSKLLGETTHSIPDKDNQTPSASPSPTPTPPPATENTTPTPAARFPQ